MRTGIFVGAVALSVTLGGGRPAAIVGQQKTEAATPPVSDTTTVSPEAVNAGRSIYHGKGGCFACHGASLEGSPVGPTLREHKWKDAKNGDRDALYQVVTHGVPGTVMVTHPGGISDAEAARVAAYVWAVNRKGAKP